MEIFVVGVITLLLIPLVLGWLLIGAALLLTPVFSVLYLAVVLPEKLHLTEANPESDIEMESILVVDDQYQSVIPLLKVLEQAKVPFRYVTNGIEALSELNRKHYRLVFMDYYMPVLTGLEVLLKADKMFRDDSPITPVIFYSGTEVAEKLSSELRHLPIVDSWNKSMTRVELNSKLNQILVGSH